MTDNAHCSQHFGYVSKLHCFNQASTQFIAIVIFFLQLAFSPQGHAGDVMLYSVVKSQSWKQTGPATITRSDGDKFVFETGIIEAVPKSVGTAAIQLPITTVERDLTRGHSASYDLSYANSSPPSGGRDISTLADFNSAYPNGNYVLRITTLNDDTRIIRCPLNGDAYPNIPQITNFDSAQAINASNPFALSWSKFEGGTASDFISLRIESEFVTVFRSGLPGTATALNGTSTSMVIPAGTLQPGKTYRVILFFAKAVLIDRTSYPGATGYIGYGQTLYTTIQTTAPQFAPRILTEPKTQTVHPGAPALFSVLATGSAPLVYQWYFNGALIQGATNASLGIRATETGDVGSYRVQVRNAAGSIWSTEALLTMGVNRVLALAGNGDHVTIPSSPLIQNGSEITLECWVYPTVTSGNKLASWINKGDGLIATSSRTYEVRWMPDETASLTLFLESISGQAEYAYLTAPVPSNRWTHLAGTFDSATGIVRFITNGVTASESSMILGFPLAGRKLRPTPEPLVLGWSPTHSGTHASGWMDEVRIWSRARTSEEIRADMSCRLSGQEPGLVGYWPFDNGSASDQSDHLSDGLFVGAAQTVLHSTADMPLSTCPAQLVVTRNAVTDRFQVSLKGRLGDVFAVEVSEELKTWRPLMALPDGQGRFFFQTPGFLDNRQQYFRVKSP